MTVQPGTYQYFAPGSFGGEHPGTDQEEDVEGKRPTIALTGAHARKTSGARADFSLLAGITVSLLPVNLWRGTVAGLENAPCSRWKNKHEVAGKIESHGGGYRAALHYSLQ